MKIGTGIAIAGMWLAVAACFVAYVVVCKPQVESHFLVFIFLVFGGLIALGGTAVVLDAAIKIAQIEGREFATTKASKATPAEVK
jgi:hypothetical protein